MPALLSLSEDEVELELELESELAGAAAAGAEPLTEPAVVVTTVLSLVW